MSTVADTVDRFEALVVLIEAGITISPRFECKRDESDLPTFIILPQGARRERMGHGDWQTTRDYVLVLLVQKICNPKSETQRQTALEACYGYLDSVPAFFMQHRFLEKDDEDTGLEGVINTTTLTDDGAQLTTYASEEFSGIRFRMSVTTGEEV